MKKKRVFSFVLAFLLIASQPFIIVSSASNLASSETGNVGDADSFYTASGSVDGHVALTAFLSASGIYLKAEGDVNSFTDVSLELDSLWSDFSSDVSGVASTIAETGASIVRGGLAYARKSWNGYCKFADWLKQKFGLEDNKINQELVESNQPVQGNLLTSSWLHLGDYAFWSGGSRNYSGSCSIRLFNSQLSSVYVFFQPDSSGSASNYRGYYVGIYNGGINTVSSGDLYIYLSSGYNNSIPLFNSVSPGQYQLFDTRFQVYYKYGGISYNVNSDIPVVTGSYVPPEQPEPEESILSVDTSDISIPDEISDNQEGGGKMGGLIIPAVGAGLGGAAGAIAGTIMQGVLDGVMPDIDIKPADVKVPPGMDIDDDGNIFPSDVEFRPTDVFLDSDAYKLDMLTNYFPFSIPWDLLQFAAMFRAEPEVPVMEFVLPMPEGIVDIVINVDLTPFEPVAALSRSGLFVLFAIRWLMFLYRKFG